MGIAIENIKPGLYVTVLRGPQTRVVHDPFGFGISRIGDNQHEDRSWQGHVLLVLAVSAPFVAVQLLAKNATLSLDVRQFELTVLTESYVMALFPRAKPIEAEPEPEYPRLVCEALDQLGLSGDEEP